MTTRHRQSAGFRTQDDGWNTHHNSIRDNREKPLPPPVHRSLRTKKRSLELPDLASLSLTPAPSHLNSPNHSPRPHYRRPKASSPIPIPSQSPATNGADHYHQSHPRPQLPSTTQMPDRHRSTPNASTRSFSRPSQANHLQPIRDIEPPPGPDTKVVSFFPETIRSTIPLGLAQADIPQPPTRNHKKISWRGGGKTVFLARAGDANWKGRQLMERSASEPETFTMTISLLPGTHHIKFIVDEHWKLAQDLPTAVDDDGSLANYVSVALPAGPSAPASPPPASSLVRPAHQISFWSQTSDPGVCTPFGDEGWTSVIPQGLISAAREEEVFLANGAVGTAPNIPPAPVLPRHLDKLILNTRIGANCPDTWPPRIPVTTASGTDVSAAARHVHTNSHSNSPVRTFVGGSTAPLGTTAAALMLADDASVLPVPSHVVLHHLSTSAIRNGVLAVGNTTRYKKKQFITTIYYKPT
ncbi:5'-AMP-activated protein kinase beta subunit, interation domain-containing protein [Lactarius sanguifluus]|nr:5'-AMP-activated protein kinase beta subunit, interation domain-containing protein [Lactarius sanguifluus]